MKFTHCIPIGGLALVWFVGAGYAQSTGASRQATSAVGNPLYQRFVSEKGRFSIEFIKEPTYDLQEFGPTAIHEFKVSDGTTKWRLVYTDFQNEVNDEDSLRAAYQTAIESLQTRPATLLSKTDIRLNGKLGVEYLMSEGEAAYATRSFLIGRRLYIISVEEHKRTKRPPAKAATSTRVRRFFDSFDFWEAVKSQPTGD